ncbi:LPS sulfotransferase NodH [Stella humosa]|uniref:LPS sulfotransferase NodH n=1 Tax=Stella humosa TaxID=94 RepID=A0A3N1MA28_9PROT|nr:Stf0 family sulfotransferase [Stella humosa]ROQ00089.1 LPS sulfotransferase NodH [Stella humosa]BBK30676.1 hypothetical protein STHU_13100 [Stella humosa]
MPSDAAGVPHESAPAFVRGNPIVSAGYDFPTFVGRARPYLLAESPRSGSQLLADLLWRTGRMGAPGEYFNREHTIPALTQRLGLASIDGPGGMDAYIRALVRHRTSANGVFGVKAHFSQLRPHLDDPSVRALVRGSRIVWLRRRDLVAQAISYLVALQSDEWRRLRGRDGATFQGRYSWRDIDRAVGMIAADERCWQVGFEQSGITPFVVWYEDLVADPDPACRGICALMGVADGLPPFALAASPLERQADPVKEEWLRRYRQTLDWGPKSPRARSAARAT